jgi:hypothetical protein
MIQPLLLQGDVLHICFILNSGRLLFCFGSFGEILLFVSSFIEHLWKLHYSYKITCQEEDSRITKQKQRKQTPWPESASKRYRSSDRRLLAKLVPTFADRGSHVFSMMDPCGRILSFLDRSCYFIFQVAPWLYSRGWVDPVPDHLLLRKSGSTWNRTRTSGSLTRASFGKTHIDGGAWLLPHIKWKHWWSKKKMTHTFSEELANIIGCLSVGMSPLHENHG